MTKRYKVNKLKGGEVVLTYSYGKYMEVQCNSKTGKTILINEVTDQGLDYRFDEIFGLGEFQKFQKHQHTHISEKHTNNVHCVSHRLIADYLPKLARKDIKFEKGGDNKQDLIDKFFK